MNVVNIEEQFRCCICLDIYTDPVSIPCGHNFCMDCIEGFWDTKEKPNCPLCKETFETRPDLRINRGFAEIIGLFKRSMSTQEENDDVVSNQVSEDEKVPCVICHGNKSTSVKSCLVCQASYCEIHLTPHIRDPVLQKHRLTDPATFTGSHLCRNHNKPLTLFCHKDQMPLCEKCTEKEHKHHEVVPMEKASKRIKTRLRTTKASVQEMIQTRQKKINEIKNTVDLSKKITEREIQSSVQVCTRLVDAIQRHQASLVEELQEKQQEADRRAEEMLNELECEINELQTRSSELQHLELTQNTLHILQGFSTLSKLPTTRDWSDVTVHSDHCMGTVRKAIFKLVDVCQAAAKEVAAAEADRMKQYAVDVTLDPDTASGWLTLTPDGKKVSLTCKKRASLPDNPRRFDSCVCILGKQSFTSGRRYWEVQVKDKTDWDLGVARESINRKGTITVRPDSGYWAICRRKGGNLNACARPTVALSLQEIPAKVGIFLDYEAKSVSFFDAEAKTHIYTYTGCSFTEPIHPYFNPCVQDNGKNVAPLVICPVEGNVTGQSLPVDSSV